MAEAAVAAAAAVAVVRVAEIAKMAMLTTMMLDEQEEELENNILGVDEKKRTRKHWVRKWIRERDDESQNNTMFKLHQQLATEDIAEFRVSMRMPPHIYGELLEMVRVHISKKNTNFRPAISADERLSLTLRHLALGDSYASLAQQYRVGRCTVGRVVADTCRGIYLALVDEYIKVPRTAEDWHQISDIFRVRWNFPHIIGAVNGKHIRIEAPPHSGSLFFNYHEYFSIVLMAVVDGNYEFLYVDVGAEGRTSDGGLWRRTPICQALKENQLDLPPERPINSCKGLIPYMLVSDDAFPLGLHVIKPYAHRDLEIRKQIFNYRLSRARRVVENAFGVMATRFRIYHQTITVRPENAAYMVLATACLHNFLRRKCGAGYIPRGSVDTENEDGTLSKGEWRKNPAITSIASLQKSKERNQSEFAKSVRNNLAEYFLTREGSIDSQYKNVYG